jgi:hypothetical protein
MSARLFVRNAMFAVVVAISTGACIPDFSNLDLSGMEFDFDECHKDDDCPAEHICVGLFLECAPANVCNSQTECADNEICTSRLAILSGEITRATCEPNPNTSPDGGSDSAGNGGAGGGSGGQGGMGNHGGQGGAAGQGGAGGSGGQGSGGQAGAAGQGGVGGMGGQGGSGG